MNKAYEAKTLTGNSIIVVLRWVKYQRIRFYATESFDTRFLNWQRIILNATGRNTQNQGTYDHNNPFHAKASRQRLICARTLLGDVPP